LVSYARVRGYLGGGNRQQRVAFDPSAIVRFPPKADISIPAPFRYPAAALRPEA